MHGLRSIVGAAVLVCLVAACSRGNSEKVESVAVIRHSLTSEAAQVQTGTALCYGAPGLQPLAPWPTTSLCALHRSQSPAIAAQSAAVAWTATLSGPVEDSAVVAADGSIYVATPQRVYALDSTGHTKWSVITPLTSGATPAIGADGTVYIGTTAGMVNALNPTNGRVLWGTLTLGIISSGIAIGTDGTLYISAQSGQLTALSPTGQTKWFVLRAPMYSSPAIGADGTVYVSGADGLHAVNPSGTVHWDLSLGALVASRSAPAVGSDGTIYLGADNSKFYAVTPGGAIRWSVTTGGAIRSSPAIANDGTIYVGSRDHKVYAVTPAGSIKWTRLTSGNVDSSPAIGADGTVYVGSDDKKLYALKPADGSVLFTLTTGGSVRGSPAIGRNGTVYVGSDDSKLYAVGPGSCSTSDATCNGVDDDCNGKIDDGFVAQTTNCGVGACRATGSNACNNGTPSDSCVPRQPQSTTDETCDGIDDNCNGQIDEGYVASSIHCGVGACASTGVTSCGSGTVKDTCIPGTPAATDTTCNGIDDNCNGQTDEGFVGTLSSCGLGVCSNTGTSTCVNGSVSPNCSPRAPLSPTDTTCDGIDDNCNGIADEGYVGTVTGCGVGVCANTGVSGCVNGTVATNCTPRSALSTTDTTCDGVDDNCNGLADEGYASQTTSCGVGACASTGATQCAAGMVASHCTPGSPAANDTTCDGMDDDCNGRVDDGYVSVQTSCSNAGCLAHGATSCSAGHVSDTCGTAGTCYAESNCADGVDNDGDGAKDCADGDCTGNSACASSVPDPRAIAPATDRTHFASTYELGNFLFSSAVPVQTGVTASAIPPERFGVARGRVLATDGTPLRDVTVSVVGHPEFGSTVTRVDGEYDLALNGGVQRQLGFARTGFLTAQRPVRVNWDTFQVLADLALVAVDPTVGSVDLTNNGQSQVVRGSRQVDQDGARQPTLLFPSAITANMVMPNGSTQPLSHLTVRVTESSVGALGAMALPAEPPPNFDYAYAASFTVDEATAAGAKSVQFSAPVPVYLENFTGLAVGSRLPVRTYDPAAGVWVTSTGGRVVKVLGITLGKADVDTNGDAVADDPSRLAAIGITDDERTNLASLYSAGATLLRVPLNHFTYIIFGPCPNSPPPDPNDPPGITICIVFDSDSDDDPNTPDDGGDSPPDVLPSQDLGDLYGQDVPDDSGQGPGGEPLDTPVVPSDPDSSSSSPDAPIENQCQQPGASTIGVENGTLREDIPIAGTPFTLNYASNRTQAAVSRGLVFNVPVSDGSPHPDSYLGATVDVTIGGQVLHQLIAPNSAERQATLHWDGLDAYGKAMVGATRGVIRTCYLYQSSRRRSSPISLCSSYVEQVTPYLSTAFGPDGWMLSAQDVYDTTGRVLTLGNGQQTGATARSLGYVVREAYSHTAGFEDGHTDLDNVAATGFVQLADGSVIAMGPNPNGVNPIPYQLVPKKTYPGDVDGFFADPSTYWRNQTWLTPVSLFVGPNGTIYAHERAQGPNNTVRDEVRRYTLDISDRFVQQGAVVATNVNPIATGPDGSLYAWGTPGQLMQYTPDGVGSMFFQSSTVDSTGKNTVAIKGHAPGSLTWINWLVTVGPDGTVYVAEQWASGSPPIFGSLYSLPPTGGRIQLLNTEQYEAGNPDINPNDSVGVTAMTVDPTTNRVTMGVGLHARIVQVVPGRVLILVGQDFGLVNGGEPLTLGPTRLWYVQNMAYGPDGLLYFSQRYAASRVSAIRRVEPSYPGDDLAPTGTIQVPSTDGRDVYYFDSGGRQTETHDAASGDLIYTFGYTQGWLTSITDRYGKRTQLVRDGSGNLQQIVAPFGQTTTITLDGAGQISSVTAPDGTHNDFTYANGMLATLTNPRSYTSRYTFDDAGKLTNDADAAGGGKVLTRDPSTNAVLVSTAENVHSSYTFERGTNGLTRVVKFANGTRNQISETAAGQTLVSYADGTQVTTTQAPDPVWGMMRPYPAQQATVYPSGRTSQRTTTRGATPLDPSKPFGPADQTQTSANNGLTTTQSYAASTRTLTMTSAQGRVTTATRDAAGTHLQVTLPGRATQKTTLDAQGRPISVTRDDGTTQRTSTYSYDGSSGYLSAVSGPVPGETQLLSVDTFGRTTQHQTADGAQTGFTFDGAGNVSSISPPTRSAHELNYTPIDLVSSYRAPDLAGGPAPVPQFDYTYTLDRNTKHVAAADGQDLDFAYGSDGNLAVLTTERGVDQYSYDTQSGKLASIGSDDGRQLAFSYDGDVTTSMVWSGAPGQVGGSVSMQYDANSWLTGVFVNGSQVVGYTRDNDALIMASGPLQITRDAASGDVTATQLGSLTTSESTSRFGELSTYACSFNSSALYSETIGQRDLAGRIVDRTETVQGTTHSYHYTYDHAGRLTDVTVDGNFQSHYAYDANGNRTSLDSPGDTKSATYDAQDRIVTYGANQYTYSAVGALNGKTDQATASTTHYDYDAFGNLRNVQLPDGRQIQYTIDASNRRIGKSINGVRSSGLLYENQLAPAAQLAADNTVVATFVYGTHPSVPDYMMKGVSTYRFVVDHLGSVRMLVNVADGSIAQRIDYDEFGVVRSDTNPGFQPFGFAAGLYDADTGLVRFGARDYDATTGRWTAKDPLLFGGGQSNLYLYLDGDPVNGVDPSGLEGPEDPATCETCTDKAFEKLINDLLDEPQAPASDSAPSSDPGASSGSGADLSPGAAAATVDPGGPSDESSDYCAPNPPKKDSLLDDIKKTTVDPVYGPDGFKLGPVNVKPDSWTNPKELRVKGHF